MKGEMIVAEATPWMTICYWEEEEEGVWSTSCKNLFAFEADGPGENKFMYCPYCGRALEVRPAPRQPDA